MIQLIYAYAGTKTVLGENEYAFGLNGDLPWGRISQDLKNFKARTDGTILIMGAKTFMSFRDPLPGRIHIVVCKSGYPCPQTKSGKNANFYITDKEFELFLKGESQELQYPVNDYPWPFVLDRKTECGYSIIGGASVLQKAYPYVDRVVQTSIDKKHRVNSDVQLPAWFVNAPRTSGSGFSLQETHFYKIDEVTDIIESVYVKDRV